MRTLLLSLVLLFGVASASEAGYRYRSQPNIWGGFNYYQGGYYRGYTRQNFYNGSNYYYNNRWQWQSRPNIYGGQNYYYGR